MTAQTDIVDVMETDETNTMMNGRHLALTDLAKGTKQTNTDWVMYHPFLKENLIQVLH